LRHFTTYYLKIFCQKLYSLKIPKSIVYEIIN
jgi:hypothetical protein